MVRQIVCIVGIIFCITFAIAEKARFDNYRVYSVNVKTKGHIEIIKELEIYRNGYELWNDPMEGKAVDILVPPHKFGDFSDFLESTGMAATIKINNLQELIDMEARSGSHVNARAGEMDWINYHTLEEMYAWIDELLVKYPNILSLEKVGTSYQGREIRAVKLSHKPGNRAIMIESHIHAREWITSATATWVLNELLTSTEPEVRDIAENIDWYIVPVINPDGFAYTKTTNRLWRKTRYPHSHLCYGTDGNRNFNFTWLEIGASSNPCSSTYAGPQPFSEPEIRAMADFFVKHKSQVGVYLAFHSYSQVVLLPYGQSSEPSNNHEELMTIGTAAADAIYQRYETEYRVGSTAVILYYTSGASQDWVKGVHNVNVSFTIEFRDRGQFGFVLPPEQIIPNAEEIFDGLKAIAKTSRTFGYL